jgi:hypothetical protein
MFCELMLKWITHGMFQTILMNTCKENGYACVQDDIKYFII